MSDSELLIRNMHREELGVLVGWATGEGWNPGLHDAEVFWATDPQAFIAAELNGELVGGGSIVSYGGQYGFMGFFIVHPQHRGQGLGNRLWHERLNRLIDRLDKPAVIGMDGVFDMQSYYAKGGFRFSGRDLRYQGEGKSHPPVDHVVALSELPFEAVNAYDRAHFPADRSAFLKLWINSPGSYARAVIRAGALAGFAVLRPCHSGFKIGPLFADDFHAANDLFQALSSQVPGELIFLDIPEDNAAAMSLVAEHGMILVFGCAKMYYGQAPVLPVSEIFGITTFELG
jgi:GNAT superfamily N-acetyltransferase